MLPGRFGSLRFVIRQDARRARVPRPETFVRDRIIRPGEQHPVKGWLTAEALRDARESLPVERCVWWVRFADYHGNVAEIEGDTAEGWFPRRVGRPQS